MAKILDHFPNWMAGAIFTRLGVLFQNELPWAIEHGQTLDIMYFGNHSGEKEASPLLDKFAEENTENRLTIEQITTLANILYTVYGKQWEKLYAVLSTEYDPIENYSMTEEETPNITRTETPNITRGKTVTEKSDLTVTTDTDTASDVYAFNSSSPVPQGETNGGSTVTTKGDAENNITTDTETETGTRTHTETGTRTLTRSGNIGVTTSQQMLESEIALWEWSFYENVFKDVDKLLTSPLYVRR